MPLLSVIVPFCNVEPYITECLKSLESQSLTDLEVILVDDGSIDGSREVAEDFVSRDDRFVLLTQKRQGPGPARNTGVRHARGAYLAFADSDDVVPPNAYELLVGSLETTGSDLACGGVERLRSGETSLSTLHAKVFRRSVERTHISRKRILVRDRTVWNKVYRRSFWEARGLEFAEGIYEDLPVAIRAHVMAEQVDVLSEIVYQWRERDSGEPSITQRREELPNLRARHAAIRQVRAFMAEAAPRLIVPFDRLVLEKDTAFLLQAVADSSPGDRMGLLELGGSWLTEMHRSVVKEAPALRRLELHLLRRGLAKELAKVRKYRVQAAGEPRAVQLRRKAKGWYGDFPYLGNKRLQIPYKVYEISEELKLVARVGEAVLDGGRLRVTGEVFIRRLEGRRVKVALWLEQGESAIPLKARWKKRRTFTAEIDAGALAHGTWRIGVRAEYRDLIKDGYLRPAPMAGQSEGADDDDMDPGQSTQGPGACRDGQEAAWTFSSSSRE
ncbi:glycosyltransferase family 2 protein [Nonomuraea sp. NPDC059194]|uniref:glycosyltransferase family 2 protein n=1 Tax=Nonomuraea sp. NPDC059194 TaxID=3346764 RepID=UPI0036A6D01D